jgi:hypothetical protein
MKKMILKCIYKLAFIMITVPALSGCVISRNIVVGISKDLEGYYEIYPSVEFNAAAVTGDEADQIKNGGVDDYFSPGNAIKQSIEPFITYFSEEYTAPQELHARSDYWSKWAGKKPEKLVFIANLPHPPDSPQDDPRLILIDIKKQFFEPHNIYIEIYPEKIVRVYKKPKDPQASK